MPKFITPCCSAGAISLVSMSAAAFSSPTVSTTGDAVLAAPPPSILYNEWESSTEIRVWDERTTQLLSDTYIGFTNTGFVNNSNQQVSGTIPAGTWVSSTMIRFDPDLPDSTTRAGSVTFDQPIIGVELGAGLGFRDPIYARPGIAYNTNEFRGLELFGQPTGTDSFEISADRLTVSFSFETGAWTDDLRVITQAPCRADLNNDGFVDSGDISTFVNYFLNGGYSEIDFNGDGFVDSGDISIFVQLFIAGC